MLPEVEDAKQRLEQQLREKNEALRASQEENERVKKGIDELESILEHVEKLTEENKVRVELWIYTWLDLVKAS